MNILLVEDKKPLSDALCKILKKESLLVDAVYTGTDGYEYLFSIIGGNGFPESLQGNESGDFPFCKVSDINGKDDYVDNALNWITNAIVEENRYNIIPSGSILIAKIGAALAKNHRKINTIDCCIDNNTQALVPKRIDIII